MNILALLSLVNKSLKQYKSFYKGNKINRRILRYNLRNTRDIEDKLIKKAIGGYDLSSRARAEQKEQNKVIVKEQKTKEYAIYKMWNSMSQGQKDQFRKWFRNKALSQARVARSFTFESELRRVQKRVRQISNKHFVERKKLSKADWQFIGAFGEFFGDVDYTPKGKITLRKTKGKIQWHKKPSSWIIAFRYVGEHGQGKKGTLIVNMIRGKSLYHFPNFPYEEYIMLLNTTGSIGKYWWKQWLWRYSTRTSRFRKYWYSGRRR